MTFDVQQARSIVTIGPRGGNWAGRYLDIAGVMAAALDRINEQEEKIEKAKTDNNHCIVADWKFEEYRKRINEQAKRIAELEVATKNMQAIISGDLKYIEAANQKTERQRAALKKLGQEKRARGKALVEERAAKIYYTEGPFWVSWEEFATCPENIHLSRTPAQNRDSARDQLRQEGLI